MTQNDPPAVRRSVPRRPLLLGAVSAGLLSTQVLGAASAETSRATGVTHAGRPWYRFNSDLTQMLPWQGPGPVTLPRMSPAVVREVLEFRWDARLVELRSAVVTAASSDGAIVTGRGRYSQSKGVAVLRVPLDQFTSLSSHGVVTVVPSFGPRPAMAQKGFESVETTSVGIVAADGRGYRHAHSVPTPQQDVVEGHAWGASLSVVWSGDDRAEAATTYAFPQTVLLRSAGPGAIPRGTRLTISTDSRAVSELSVRSATTDDGSSADHRSRGSSAGPTNILTATLEDPLPADGAIIFEFDATRVDTAPNLTERSACTVAVTGPLEGPPQLTTGAEALALIS